MRKLIQFLTANLVLVFLLLASANTMANRLADDSYNRCGSNQLPVSQCAQYQDLAYNNGAGCITAAEYTYAKANLIAPICSPFDATQYVGFCRCGCFQEGTRIYSYNPTTGGADWIKIETMLDKGFDQDLFTVAQDATLSNMMLDSAGIRAMTVGPEEKPLIIIETVTGKVVGLTETHGVLLASGTMTTAGKLTADDVLVNAGGEAEAIASLTLRSTNSDVYNVLTDASFEDKNGHLVVAEGLILGDLYWQNILVSEMTQFEIRQ
jgi:hypothetical protein